MRIEQYQSANGRVPFDEWFDSLDGRNRKSVDRRLRSLREFDHFGDTRSLRGGLYELRLLGPGLRIYFARVDQNAILILGGSDKRSQKKAIKLARIRLQDIQRRIT